MFSSAPCRPIRNGLYSTLLAKGQPFGEKNVDGFENPDLVLLGAAHDVIEHLEALSIFKSARLWQIRSIVEGVTANELRGGPIV